MSNKFYLKDIAIKNFRSFGDIEIKKLHRINVIGGLNAAGKSALLETLFLVLDRRSPAALLKPLLWRMPNEPLVFDPDLFFYDPSNNQASVQAKHRDGTDALSIKRERPPVSVTVNIGGDISGAIVPVPSGLSSGDQMGINIETKRNGKAEDGLYTMSTPSGAAGNIYRVSPTAIPLAQYIGQRVKGNSAELSARVSDIIRSKRLPELVAAVSLMAPGVTSLQVLQGPSGPTVVADVSGEFVPTALLGDGFNNYLQVVAGLLWASGGVLFLDEVDVSFHYSVRRVAWKTICGLASAQNCQIFSVSHSMEAITDACRGAIDAGCEKDFEYIRLEHTGGVYAPVRYSAGELLASEQANIDVR